MTDDEFKQLGTIWIRMGTSITEMDAADTYGLCKDDPRRCVVYLRHFSYGDVLWYRTHSDALLGALEYFKKTGKCNSDVGDDDLGGDGPT